MEYPTNLWKAMLVSIALHFLAAIVLIFAFPKIFPAPEIPEVTPIEWVDVNLDEIDVEEEFVTIEPLASNLPSEFEFAQIELPPLEIPKLEPLPQLEIALPKPPEPPPAPKEETPPKVEVGKKSEQIEEPTENQQWVSVPILIEAVYPEESFGYAGEVMIMATISKDGKVKNANLVFPTGNVDVDTAALEAAQKWIFKPALDKNGKPTECSYSIVLNFKKIFDEE